MNFFETTLNFFRISHDKEAIKQLCSFICKNYPIFGLSLYDEDFREEIILTFLENGEKMLDRFNYEPENFFPYFYNYVRGLIQTKKRKIAKENVMTSVAISESIKELEDKEYSYQNIDYSLFDIPSIPYSHTNVTLGELQDAFKNVKKNKALLVLSMKSIFYITDYQIKTVSNFYDLNPDFFYKLIQYCKKVMYTKITKKQKMEECRNHFYYNHKQNEKRIEILDSKDSSEENKIKRKQLEELDKKNCQSFKRTNDKINKGILYLRPTNKLIATILNICERQVEYYLICAKKKIENGEWPPFD